MANALDDTARWSQWRPVWRGARLSTAGRFDYAADAATTSQGWTLAGPPWASDRDVLSFFDPSTGAKDLPMTGMAMPEPPAPRRLPIDATSRAVSSSSLHRCLYKAPSRAQEQSPSRIRGRAQLRGECPKPAQWLHVWSGVSLRSPPSSIASPSPGSADVSLETSLPAAG